MFRLLNHVRWISAALLLMLFAGCGRGGTPTYPAGGTVKYEDGSPLFAGSVSFRSLDSTDGPSARGDVQADGSFELTTFSPGDGAVLGRHQAVVVLPTQGGRPGFKLPTLPPPIAPRFSSFETSGLEFTVTENPDQNHFAIVVTKNK
jgi:hypothetical protein